MAITDLATQIEELKKKAEEKGYHCFSIGKHGTGNAGAAILKKFDTKPTLDQAKYSPCTEFLYVLQK